MADLVSRIKEIAQEAARQVTGDKELSEKICVLMEEKLRAERSGDRGYISASSPEARERKIKEVRSMFNGRNATTIARKLNIGRATVYRILKTPG